MPISEYECGHGHVFGRRQRMSDDPLADCIECGTPVRKVLQPVGIGFKGSGFYSTDYNNKKGPKEEPKKAAATSGESSTNGASDSKAGSEKPEKTSTEPAKKGD